MPVSLICRPGKEVTWEQFKHYPRFSFAIDGFCKGPPRTTADGRVHNINHHEGVDRVATRSSCAQSLCLVKLGLFELVGKDPETRVHLFVNDADLDATWATYVLMHPEYIDRPKLRSLVQLEDYLDMSSGLFPIDNDNRKRILGELCWIGEPYTGLRAAGKLGELDDKSMRELILGMHRRITACLYGRGKRLAPDTRFEELERHAVWSFVREVGAHARYGMSEHGIKAFLALVREEEGRYHYAFGRLSNLIPFPILHLYGDLNKAEGADLSDANAPRWGGSGINGGSPRGIGSRLTPEEVTAIIEDRIRRTKEARPAVEAFEREIFGNGK